MQQHLGRFCGCSLQKLLSYFLVLATAISIEATPTSALADIIPPVVVTSSTLEDSAANDGDIYSINAASANIVLNNISSRAIKEAHPFTLASLLQSQTGIQVNDLYGDGSRITLSLRGFGDNAFGNVLVLIDGMPWANPDIELLNFAEFPLAIIDHIEILPASDSVLYGDQAVGGIINIITKKAQKNRRALNVGYGSFENSQASIDLSDVFANNIGYSLDGIHATSDNYRDHNEAQNNNGSVLFSYTNRDLQGFMRYTKFNQHFQLPGELTYAQAHDNPRQAENNFAFSNQDSDFWQGNLNKSLGQFGNIKLDGTLSRTLEHNAQGVHGIPYFFDAKRENVNTNIEVSYLFNDFWFAPHSKSGIFLQNSNYEFIAKDSSQTSKQQETAAYSEFDFHLSPRFTLTAGGRLADAAYDLPPNLQNRKMQPNNTAVATNLALNFDATKTTRFFLHRASSYRFPKVDEQTYTLDGKPLETQRGISYEGGINYAKPAFKILAEIYRLILRDELINIPVKDAKFSTYNENLDPTKRDGILADTTVDLAKWGQLTVGGNHIAANFTTGPYKGKKLPFVSENTCHAAENFVWHEHWHFMVEEVFSSSRYPVNDVENRTPKLGGFTVYNFALGYERKRYDISLRVNNVTNKSYYGYVVAKYIGNETELGFFPATGINAFVNVNLHL